MAWTFLYILLASCLHMCNLQKFLCTFVVKVFPQSAISSKIKKVLMRSKIKVFVFSNSSTFNGFNFNRTSLNRFLSIHKTDQLMCVCFVAVHHCYLIVCLELRRVVLFLLKRYIAMMS